MSKKKNLLSRAEINHAKKLSADGRAKDALDYATNAARLKMFLTASASIDAIRPTSKRKTPVANTSSLDAEFSGQWDRDTMVTVARDLEMNFSLARGLIQTHINNVVGSGPRIQFHTDDSEFNDRGENYFYQWGRQCDIRGVLNWGRFIRMVERRTIVDGDCGTVLTNRMKLQGVEADRIANPPDVSPVDPDWVYGVRVDDLLTPKGYGVYRRGTRLYIKNRMPNDYVRTIPARYFVHSFDPDRFDQVRGISALISAINDLQDSREALEAIKGTIKLENILALVLKMNQTSNTSLSPLGDLSDFSIDRADGAEETRREVKISQGVNTIEIGPDEDVSAIEKKTPGSMFNDWMMLQIRLCACALDMPLEIAFHFYTRGSFSSLKGAIGQYHSTVKIRRNRLEEQVCSPIARWLINTAIKLWLTEEANNIPEYMREGLRPPDGKIDGLNFEWQWDQLPFLEPDKQIKADIEEYKAGVTTVQDMCGKRSKDWEEVLKQRAIEYNRAVEISEQENVPIETLIPQINTPGQQLAGESDEVINETEDDE